MKFLLEFVTCSRSCSLGKQNPAEDQETRLFVVQEPRRRAGRKQGKVRGGGREWRPSLSSISEDMLMAERINSVEKPAAAGWRRCLKRKVSSLSRRDRTHSLDSDDKRRPPPLPTIIPTFAPTPFMF